MERFLSVREACARLGIHPNTLRRWDKEGKIRVVRPVGGKRRVPESEISRILGSQPPAERVLNQPDLFQSFFHFVFTRCRDDAVLVKRAIMLRDGEKCTKCGATKNLVVVPQNLQGAPEDLKTMCKSCAGLQKNEEKEIIEKKEDKKEVYSQKEITRIALLEDLAPQNLLQRTAFGDMISAACSLRRFTPEGLSARSRCPIQLATLFCEQMLQRGYLRRTEDGMYELLVKVTA